MTVVVYQSGQKVERTGWYEPIGVTQPLTTPPVVAKLETGTAFPDWKGRAICWRLYTLEDIPQGKTVTTKAGV
jgi:hypothetical protein